ncbi:tyrosine-type recombinase/integrase [Flavobacterium sp. F-328]|uniref:Tyrosine-type recombinase/integrase n=1 Tax=Flavobacterium erciyesense TaxID=2825842 RepID=A0ABS5D167_9FLAO|nr:tyrosine-type recombinase/integrase [Flavobacterium erciyesense]MBQ0907761.1 tyrosine-type recombinase/integrase [Flavobacterium erciyesense]
MSKLRLPKKSYKGIKIFCKICNTDNTNCKHYDKQVYRVRVHVPGTQKSVKTKKLDAVNYDDAVIEAIAFEKELNATDFITIGSRKSENITEDDQGNDYSIADAIIRFNQYLNGQTNYAHLKKNISLGYKDELIRYCRFFCKNINLTEDISKFRVKDVSKKHVSNFYSWAEARYAEKTFNKCMAALKCFFEFLIDIEDIEIKNPFRKYVIKEVVKSSVETVSRDEFLQILAAIDTIDPLVKLGGKGQRKSMYRHYLKDGFRLFLLTGSRREEVVNLRWSDIYISPSGVKFFRIKNIKVERIKNKEGIYKYIPINDDLFNLLAEMGFEKNKNSNNYILFPERDVSALTIMNILSKAFTYYRIGAGIKKDIGLKNLRKTYITWVNQVMNKDTKILSSHSTDGVLQEYYIDPTVLTAIEKGALEIKIFG